MMKKLILASVIAALSTSAMAAEQFAKPADFGITDEGYRVSESNFYIQKHLKKAGINEFAHQRNIVNVESQQVIRENQDILYSSAVVDVSKGVTLSVPEYDAYSIIQVIDMQNYSIATIYPGESVTLTSEDLSYGNYVYLNARTQPTSGDEAGLVAARAQQDALSIKANAKTPYEVPQIVVSDEKMVQVRTALIKDVRDGKLKDYTRIMGTADYVDTQGHLYASAYGWGGLPISDAAYMTIPVEAQDGKCSSLAVDVPPLKYNKGGFWSVTTYGTDGWIARDKAAISNNEAVANKDGTYTVRFNCDGMANNIDTPDQFAVLLRAYAPEDTKSIGQYLANAQKHYTVKSAK